MTGIVDGINDTVATPLRAVGTIASVEVGHEEDMSMARRTMLKVDSGDAHPVVEPARQVFSGVSPGDTP